MKHLMMKMNFAHESNNKLMNLENTPCKRLLNKLNKWSSMPLLQIYNKQGIDSNEASNMGKLKYSSTGLDASNYQLIGLSAELEVISNTEKSDTIEYGHLSTSSDISLKRQFPGPPNISSEKAIGSSVSLQALEYTIDTCNILGSKELVYEQLPDASLLSIDESDASSLLSVLDTLKFNTPSEYKRSHETKPENDTVHLESQNEYITVPLKTNENLFYVRRNGARRNLRNLVDDYKPQANSSDHDEIFFVERDSFPKEYLMEFKERLKEIRKENMIPITRKPIHNGNRFSRVFNYCFLAR